MSEELQDSTGRSTPLEGEIVDRITDQSILQQAQTPSQSAATSSSAGVGKTNKVTLLGRKSGARQWGPAENIFLIAEAEARSCNNETSEKDSRWGQISDAILNKFGGMPRSTTALKDHYKGLWE